MGFPYMSVVEMEKIVSTRMWERAAELKNQGITLTDEDFSRLWNEEYQRLKEQMQKRLQRDREQLRKFLKL